MRRITMVSLFLLLLALITTGRPTAGEYRSSSVSTVAQTQHEMNQQAEDEYKKADAELNRVYRELMGHLSGEQKKALTVAELAWIKFRDTNCACWALVHRGGSLYPLMHFGHMKSMTEERTKQLNVMKRDMLIDEGH
jgi:uncharacterized protein YecT (DUF1311 family)